MEEQYEDLMQMMMLLTHLVSRDFIDFDENGVCTARGGGTCSGGTELNPRTGCIVNVCWWLFCHRFGAR